mmetsp:Transcript_25324/g.54013  ORF Transcript_25324/g.54013 Transcript_25324/m.54013 type:complete len:317 (-) Transcript_25324:2093-3043(-)
MDDHEAERLRLVAPGRRPLVHLLPDVSVCLYREDRRGERETFRRRRGGRRRGRQPRREQDHRCQRLQPDIFQGGCRRHARFQLQGGALPHKEEAKRGGMEGGIDRRRRRDVLFHGPRKISGMQFEGRCSYHYIQGVMDALGEASVGVRWSDLPVERTPAILGRERGRRIVVYDSRRRRYKPDPFLENGPSVAPLGQRRKNCRRVRVVRYDSNAVRGTGGHRGCRRRRHGTGHAGNVCRGNGGSGGRCGDRGRYAGHGGGSRAERFEGKQAQPVGGRRGSKRIFPERTKANIGVEVLGQDTQDATATGLLRRNSDRV